MNKSILFFIYLGAVIFGGCSNDSINRTASVSQIESQKIIGDLRRGTSVYFDTNSSDVNESHKVYLQLAAKVLAEDPRVFIILTGYTDNTGTDAVNKRVSFARVNAVRRELIDLYHVNSNQIVTKGEGANHPIETNETESGRAKNRRVDLILKIR
nr:OmpA family protein [Acinetobacter sp. Marseille-Q1620]